jgi:hypothetical protein
MAKLKTGTRVFGNLTVDSSVSISSQTLSTAVVGKIEYDGSFLYHTPNSTSGRASIPPVYTFRYTNSASPIGPTIADVFTTPSTLSLEASSVYKVSCFVWFAKTTAGTATWTQTFSAAPFVVEGYHYVTPVTGMTNSTAASYTPISQNFYDQNTTTYAWNPSGTNLTTGVNHFYRLDMTLTTSTATNWRLRLTQSAGTATVNTSSYYTIQKISTSTGTFVA